MTSRLAKAGRRGIAALAVLIGGCTAGPLPSVKSVDAAEAKPVVSATPADPGESPFVLLERGRRDIANGNTIEGILELGGAHFSPDTRAHADLLLGYWLPRLVTVHEAAAPIPSWTVVRHDGESVVRTPEGNLAPFIYEPVTAQGVTRDGRHLIVVARYHKLGVFELPSLKVLHTADLGGEHSYRFEGAIRPTADAETYLVEGHVEATYAGGQWPVFLLVNPNHLSHAVIDPDEPDPRVDAALSLIVPDPLPRKDQEVYELKLSRTGGPEKRRMTPDAVSHLRWDNVRNAARLSPRTRLDAPRIRPESEAWHKASRLAKSPEGGEDRTFDPAELTAFLGTLDVSGLQKTNPQASGEVCPRPGLGGALFSARGKRFLRCLAPAGNQGSEETTCRLDGNKILGCEDEIGEHQGSLLSPDGRFEIRAGVEIFEESSFRLVDLGSGKDVAPKLRPLGSLAPEAGPGVIRASFSPDGRSFAAIGEEPIVFFYEIGDGGNTIVRRCEIFPTSCCKREAQTPTPSSQLSLDRRRICFSST